MNEKSTTQAPVVPDLPTDPSTGAPLERDGTLATHDGLGLPPPEAEPAPTRRRARQARTASAPDAAPEFTVSNDPRQRKLGLWAAYARMWGR